MPEGSSTTTVHSVELSLKAVLEDFVRGLRSAEAQSKNSAGQMGRNFQSIQKDVVGVRDAVNGLKSTFTSLFATIGLGIGLYQVKNFLADITNLAGRVEVLEVVSRNMGKTAGYTREEVIRYVQAVKDLNITTQEANLSVTKFMQADLPLDKLTKIVRVAQDTGVIMGKTSQESLAGIVHGIITLQPEVLRTYGIFTNLDMAYRKFARTTNITYDEISQQQKQQIALNEVLEKGAVFQGTYETAMSKAQKQMLSLTRVFEEFKLSIGREFQMLFSELVVKTTDLFTVGKGSEELHSIFRSIANGLFYLTKAMMSAGKTAWEFREAIKFAAEVFIIIKALSYFSQALGAVASALAWVRANTLLLITNITTFGLTLASLAILKELPRWCSWVAIGIGVLAIAFSRLAVASSAAWGSVLTPIGSAVAVAGTLALLFSSFEALNLESEKAAYDQKQLESSTASTASEFRVGRRTALDLALGIEELGKKSELTTSEVDEVHKSFERLRKLAPDLVTDVTDIKDIFIQSARAVKVLDEQMVDLNLNQMSVQLQKLKDQAQGLELGHARALFPDKDELGSAFNQWIKDANAFQVAVKEGQFDLAEWQRLNTEYRKNDLALGIELNRIEHDPEKKDRKDQLGAWATKMTEAYVAAGRFGDKVESIVDLQDQMTKLESARTTLSKGLSSELLTQEQIENRLQAKQQLKMQLFELEGRLTKEGNFLKGKELEVEKDIAQAMEVARKARNLGETGKEYSDLLKILETYKEKMSAIHRVEFEILRIRQQEKEMKIGVKSSDVEAQTKLKEGYEGLIASLKAIPNLTQDGIDLMNEYIAIVEAMGVSIPELMEKLAKKTEDAKERAIREQERQDRRLAKGWLSDVGAQALAFRTFMGTYRGFINTIVDMEMTGKQRREAIWQDMLQTFSEIIDLMIRKYLIFQAITGIFGLPGGVANELLGFGTGGGGGLFSSGAGNKAVVRELQETNRILRSGEGEGASQTVTLTSDRLAITVNNGKKKLRRNSLGR